MKITRLALFASTACASALFAAAPAQAQGTDADQPPSLQNTPGEDRFADAGDIVITARKREESIMNVPVVATAVSQEQLENFQTHDLKALSSMVPGLVLGTSILSVGLQASLRGIGTSALDPGVDSSVALNLDGLPLSQGLAFASGMFDVGQLEVLKGPQSLFYGKSSPAGVISIRTADPTDEFELIARAGYEFEADERVGELIVSGPVTERLKLRVAGQLSEQEGFFRNNAIAIPALGARNPVTRRISPAWNYKFRVTVVGNPTDNIDMRLKVNRVYDDTLYPGTSQNALCPDGTGPVLGRQFIDPNDCTLDRSVPLVDLDPAAFPGVPNNGTPYNETLQTFGTLEVDFKLRPDLTLTSSTGYYHVKSNNMINGTMTSAGAGILSAINNFRREQFTQELRLTSDFDGPFNFLLGGFLERGEFSDDVIIGGNTRLGLPPVLQAGKKSVDIETNSIFGQLLYKIVPELEIAAGARWTDETRTHTGLRDVLAGGLRTGVRTPIIVAQPEINAKNIAPELTITYTPTEDLTVFGALKQGYKSGSYNVSTPPFAGERNHFGDEKVQGGEVGIKSRLLDRQIMLNVAAYYYKYSGLQVGTNVPNPGGGVPITATVNAGAARVYGIDADINYRPRAVDGLNLRASVNWNNSRYTTLRNIPCYDGQMISEGCNAVFNPALNGGLGGFSAQDRSGLPLIRAPRWQATAGFAYELPVGTDMKVVLAGNALYSSSYLTNLAFPYYIDQFIKADASVALKGAQDRWELALIGRNLTNQITAGNCAASNRAGGQLTGVITGTNTRGPGGVAETGCYADRGRELWVRATLRY